MKHRGCPASAVASRDCWCIVALAGTTFVAAIGVPHVAEVSRSAVIAVTVGALSFVVDLGLLLRNHRRRMLRCPSRPFLLRPVQGLAHDFDLQLTLALQGLAHASKPAEQRSETPAQNA